jgi:hypothetical protein
MADITMCEGNDCPKKQQCYRFTAEKNPYRQAYFFQHPLQKNGDCDEFIKIHEVKNEKT